MTTSPSAVDFDLETLHVGVLLYDGVEPLDAIGPAFLAGVALGILSSSTPSRSVAATPLTTTSAG